MAATDDLNNVASRLEAAANTLGAAIAVASGKTKASAEKDALIEQHVSRLTAVANAIANAAAALTAAANG